MCICLYMCECRNPQGPEESIRVPRTGVTGGCDCCACWESNFGPLEGQPFSLITESPLIDFSTFIECHLSQALPVYLWCIHGWQRDKILFLTDFLGLIKKEYNAWVTLCVRRWKHCLLILSPKLRSGCFLFSVSSLPSVVLLCCWGCQLCIHVDGPCVPTAYLTISPGCLWTSPHILQWTGNSSNQVLPNPCSSFDRCQLHWWW